uniref:RNase H type-1 domain-containing protein n=1 Tax=Trichogramma kaykai TaxID=54128 RepID=A0ABD2WBI3_9HYME
MKSRILITSVFCRGLDKDDLATMIQRIIRGRINNVTQVIVCAARRGQHRAPSMYRARKGAASVGYGIFCPATGYRSAGSLSPQCSIFTAECCAIKEALTYIESLDNKKFVIVSDSLSATISIQSPGAGRKVSALILDIKERLASYANNNLDKKVSLLWIPSHMGIVGNEVVDAVAKEATKNQPPDPAFIPSSDLSESFALEAKNNSNIKNMVESRERGKQYFEEFYSTCSTPWFSNVKIPRRHIVMINRMRANHTCLAESLERKNIISDAGCRCGCDKETLNHILWDCRLYQTQRKVLLERLKRIGLFSPLKVEHLIARPNIEACTMLCDFFIGLGVLV